MTPEISNDILAALRRSEVIAYPTEAVWGLGCDPDSTQALERIMALKQRDPAKGVILVAADITQFAPWLDGLEASLYTRLEASWPGPVTWLVPDNGRAHPLVRGEHAAVALRVSAHPLVQALCHRFGGPIVSTSANKAGQMPCLCSDEVRSVFGDSVTVVEGSLGGRTRPSDIFDLVSGHALRA
ncbi:Sua5/YciO/YrdC/YwlC family protein [Phytohalomonas tamaricis]|uniref:Sua5/YciO/YrdC/YwlC family protein n=1 Tax=Phytohalomonas tamaricis TaxID=2081032 RepID=UPI000D0BBB36|nr:Sua5/YciO/YrdC/YwlC family protein [Phytohalomonas tamaricis]